MDRYSKLATLALLGSASGAATVRNLSTNPLQYDQLAAADKLTTSDTEAFASGYANLVTPYKCIRSGGNYFFPQKYTNNAVATGAQSFYIHDKLHTMLQLNFTGGAGVAPLTTVDTAGSASASTTTVAVNWNTAFYQKITLSAASSGNVTAGSSNLVKNLVGRSDCCPKIKDNTNNTECQHQLTYTGLDSAATTTVWDVSGQIPVGRIWYKGPATFAPWSQIAHRCIYQTQLAAAGTTVACGTKGSGTNNVVEEAQFILADAAAGAATKGTLPVWNNDFLLASLYQLGDKTGGSNQFCNDAGATSGAEQVYGLDAGVTAAKSLQMKSDSNKEKCTWFIASQGDATASHSSSFQLTAANYVKFQLHWAEWQGGNIASANLLKVTGETEDTNFRPGLMVKDILFASVASGHTSSQKIVMQWPLPMKVIRDKNEASVTPNTMAGPTMPFVDDFTMPTWGPTKGYLGFLSGNIKGSAEKAYSLVDFNQYNLFRLDYNKQVAAYNTAAKTYSDAAKKYSDDVAARKKQLADPMNASFATPVAIPKVPCLNFNKPAAWAGATPYVPTSAGNLDALATQADRASKFVYAYPKSAAEFNTPLMQVTKTSDASSTYNYDFKSGFVVFNSNNAATSANAAEAGVNHVFGLLGQGSTDATVTTTTFTEGLKAHRWSAPASPAPNYMMVSLLPYSKTTGDYYVSTTAAVTTIKVFKNDWSTDATTFAFDTATAPANEVKEADQFTGAKALIATATAFAAVAMTLQ